MPIASRVLPLLEAAKAFNLQISAHESGQEDEFHAGLSTLVLPKLAGLAEAGIQAELLVAESSWTGICQDGVLRSLAARETFVSRHLYCACIAFHWGGAPLWTSQIIVDDNGSIAGLQACAYPCIRANADVLRGKRIFVSYAGRRRDLVAQITAYLAGFGASTWDYHRDDCRSDLDMGRLEHSLYQQMSASDAILVIQDNLAYQSTYSTAEAIYALRTYDDRTVVVRVADSFDHTTLGQRSGTEPYFSYRYSVPMCICHWPERLGEVGAALTNILGRQVHTLSFST